MWDVQNVKSILQECYGDSEAVTDELVDYILKPGLQVFPAQMAGCWQSRVLAGPSVKLRAARFCHCSDRDAGMLCMQPGAVDVFLDFISYSGGPLPEELLPQVSCPVSILWGEKDPWEPIEKGRAYGEFDCVEEFIPLPGEILHIL